MENIETAVHEYVAKAQEIINTHYSKHFTALTPPVLTEEWGKRYVRIVSNDTHGTSRSVHTFIDMTNGDVLKASSWKAPAKHARGNVFSEQNGMEGVDAYGGKYLR